MKITDRRPTLVTRVVPLCSLVRLASNLTSITSR